MAKKSINPFKMLRPYLFAVIFVAFFILSSISVGVTGDIAERVTESLLLSCQENCALELNLQGADLLFCEANCDAGIEAVTDEIEDNGLISFFADMSTMMFSMIIFGLAVLGFVFGWIIALLFRRKK